MGDILEISTPSHRNELCRGIGHLLDSDEVGSDFEFSCVADSTPIKAHFFVLQIFCRALQNSNCRRIHFESAEIQREDVRCLLEFIYRGKTLIQENRLDAVKQAAVKLRLETFLDLVKGIKVKSVEEAVTIENVTDTENEEKVCESLMEDEDNVEKDEDSSSVDRDYTDCSEEEEEQKSNVGKHEENGDIRKHLAFKKYDLRSYRGGNLSAHLTTKHQMDLNGQELDAHCATDKNKLKRRKLSTHSKERDYACETCGKCFQKANNLWMHKWMHAEKVDCEICGKKLGLRSIPSHRKLHEIGGDKKFKCTICDVRCRDRFNLKVHLKNVHHISEGKIARLVNSEATRISDKELPQSNEDLGKIKWSFKGRK